MKKKTLLSPVSFEGIGVHSGEKVLVTIKPASHDTGIVFVRTDQSGSPFIPGTIESVVDTSFCTTLGREGQTISTVEHLMSALCALGVDNALVEVNAPEMPILDGSASPFLEGIKAVGLRDQDFTRSFLRLKRPFSVTLGESYIHAFPSDALSISVNADLSVEGQEQKYTYEGDNFAASIAAARTFSKYEDVVRMQSAGYIKGGSLDNALVIKDGKAMNGLRSQEECARHKILDMIGDFYLAGAPFLARIEAFRPGHTLNYLFMKQLLADESAWELVGVKDRPALSEAHAFS